MSIQTIKCSQCKKGFSINPVSGVPVMAVCPVCAPKINRGISQQVKKAKQVKQSKQVNKSKHQTRPAQTDPTEEK